MHATLSTTPQQAEQVQANGARLIVDVRDLRKVFVKRVAAPGRTFGGWLPFAKRTVEERVAVEGVSFGIEQGEIRQTPEGHLLTGRPADRQERGCG